MCGIAGLWGSDDRALVQRVMDGLAHRGPDGEGIHVERNGVLGHRRLAIMDPEGGDQPLYSEHRSAAIVANGEIYNYPALRPDLERRHELATTSDNEAILHLWEELDGETPSVLAGMYAFAIADGERLFLARDPIGIKPLYWGRARDGNDRPVTVFASEMGPLVDWVDELEEFPPGHWYDSRIGLRRFYSLPDGPPAPRSTDEHVAAVRAALEAAVESHLMSDVPVGAFLSGGLDSSVIAALARRHITELHTFAVGAAGSPDLEAARRMADHLGTIHHEYELTADEVARTLPDVVRSLESFDQDLVRSAIPTYFVSRLAARYVKVILTGEGADELFAGYAYHKEVREPATLHRELIRSVAALHNINLQRVDRLTMLHGLEGRVPFLDTAFIELGLSVPPELKICPGPDGRPIEKWVLRKACEDLLPSDIVWRVKEQFDEGSGTLGLLDEVLAPMLRDPELETWRREAGDTVRSTEEALYHRILTRSFRRPEMILRNVARWTEDRHA